MVVYDDYNVFRWYREEWRRYTQADPAFNPTRIFELAPYSYAGGAPITHVDPLGLIRWTCDVRVGGGSFPPSAPVGVAAVGIEATCKSDCLRYAGIPKRETVTLEGVASGASAGAPVTYFTMAGIQLFDDTSVPDSSSLVGLVHIGPVGLQVGPIELSYTEVRFGQASNQFFNAPGTGFSVGVSSIWGYMWRKQEPKWECCQP